MNRSIVVSVVAVVAIAPVSAQDVAYEKYQLANGMTVILHEDHSLPVAAVNIWYKVGSKDEKERRSGFAHLFEHLMFMGTQRVPGADFDNIMEAGGGANNASTSEDRTNYYESGPAELLPTLLWLEADRLEHLGVTMTQEKLDKQRDVVRNERRQSYENAPYGKAELRIPELMYPPGHPYHHTVIGSHEDLEAGTVQDVKDFFATYYVPSNASMVVAGDFDPAKIKPLIDQLFSSLPRGSDAVHMTADPVTLDKVIRATMTDQVQFARSTMVYHSPAHFQPGDAEMDLAAAVLTEGISSRLYQKLIYENEYATEVSAFQASTVLGSMFYINATARPGVSLDTVEQSIDEVLAAFCKSGPTADELERQKAQIEYRMLSSLQSVLAKADRLNLYEFHLGEPNSFKRDLDRYRQATPQGVAEWGRKVLTPEARLVMRVIPEIKTPEVNPRDARPTAEAAPKFNPLLPETFKLGNGITVHHWRRTELPLVSAALVLPTGSALDGAEKAGLAALTADMLDEGAGDLGAIQYADALDQLGATVRTSASHDASSVRLSVLGRNFGAALKLYSDAVMRPRFNAEEWKRVHELHVQELVQDQDEPTVVASRVAMRAYFGDEHPYGRPTVGTPTTAEKLTLEDIKGAYTRLYRPSTATLLVAGDIETDGLKKQLESTLGQWKEPAGAAPAPAVFPEPANRSQRVVMVHRPDAVQTVVRFMMPGIKYSDPRRPRLQLVNTILGGSFTSRLNQNLRERNGYTYGARSGFVMNPVVGYFTASSSVRADVTGASVREFLNEFNGLRGGNISAGEAEKARSTRRMAMIDSFAGLDGIIGAAIELVLNRRPFSELGDELDQVAKMTDADLNQLTYEAVPLEQSVLVLVGDKSAIEAQLAELKLPAAVELDALGAPVK